MNIFRRFFSGPSQAEKVGNALWKYFESEDFPEELLQYPELNVLYREFKYDRACQQGLPEGKELIDYLEALLALHHKETNFGSGPE